MIWSSYDLLDETAKKNIKIPSGKYWTMTVTRSAMKNGQKKYIAGWTTNEAI